MSGQSKSKGPVLVVGASGSIGRFVAAEALYAGYETRVLVRHPDQVSLFPEGVHVLVGGFNTPDAVSDALERVESIVFTQGVYGNDPEETERVNYGAVRNVLLALRTPTRVALMTTLGVTKPTHGHDWKRRGERLLRASGLPYTIVRPGWFDYNGSDQHRLVMLQGDRRWAGDPSDGVISRRQLAQVLVASLSSDPADRKTFELVAETGTAPADLDPLFTALQNDPEQSIDGILDQDNLPLNAEPARVLHDLKAVRAKFNRLGPFLSHRDPR